MTSRAAWLLALSSFLLLVGGCATPPSVFPRLEQPLSDAEVLEVLDRRTAVPGYSGLVSLDYRDPEVSGVLEAVVNWRPEHLRVTAFKGLVVTDYDVFDLLLVPDGYALRYLDDEREDRVVRGSLAEFTRTRPRQASFYWIGEALLLPGRTVGAATVRRDDGLRVEGLLLSGARASFVLDPETLAVLRARIAVPGEARTLELIYADYLQDGAAFLPGRVELLDPALEVRVTVEVEDGARSEAFEDYVFDLDDVGGE
ncbi:MAG: hypothetical protein R3F62_01420 [Planctomycetota bacterium]